ncbi:MAG: hypothetical protein Q8M34_06955 [Thermodesulfovibrionales bacterium]|nr:hypothetical protein [Thermodesulfovibrionales bacterium]
MFLILRIVSAILLLWALSYHSYEYYTILRFVVTGVAAYSAYISVNLKKKIWTWSFGIITILFNPFVPIHLDKDTWAVIDVLVAIFFIVSLFFVNNPTKLPPRSLEPEK